MAHRIPNESTAYSTTPIRSWMVAYVEYSWNVSYMSPKWISFTLAVAKILFTCIHVLVNRSVNEYLRCNYILFCVQSSWFNAIYSWERPALWPSNPRQSLTNWLDIIIYATWFFFKCRHLVWFWCSNHGSICTYCCSIFNELHCQNRGMVLQFRSGWRCYLDGDVFNSVHWGRWQWQRETSARLGSHHFTDIIKCGLSSSSALCVAADPCWFRLRLLLMR